MWPGLAGFILTSVGDLRTLSIKTPMVTYGQEIHYPITVEEFITARLRVSSWPPIPWDGQWGILNQR